MLEGFDVSACRQPELGIFVIDQKDITFVNNGKVRDQMLGRSRWLRKSEQFSA